MAYTAWRGALEITISGFPVPVPVVFNPRTGAAKSNSGLSLLSPDGRPVFQRYVTDDEGWSGTIGQCARGKDGIKLDDQVVAQLADSERDRLVTPHSFAPLESIDLSIAQGSYAVVPDEQAAGASRQLEVLWNGLRSTGLAYITQIVLRGGSPASRSPPRPSRRPTPRRRT
jgi:non-homologous end joining protein Ku